MNDIYSDTDYEYPLPALAPESQSSTSTSAGVLGSSVSVTSLINSEASREIMEELSDEDSSSSYPVPDVHRPSRGSFAQSQARSEPMIPLSARNPVSKLRQRKMIPTTEVNNCPSCGHHFDLSEVVALLSR